MKRNRTTRVLSLALSLVALLLAALLTIACASTPKEPGATGTEPDELTTAEQPTNRPTEEPTNRPTEEPTQEPTDPSEDPTEEPTTAPEIPGNELPVIWKDPS